MNRTSPPRSTEAIHSASERRVHSARTPNSAARVRISSPDPFGGARGHDYIRLRGLAPKIGAVSRGAATECNCEPCVQARLLPAVQAICNRREHAESPGAIDWRDVHNEHAHDLLDVPTVIGR